MAVKRIAPKEAAKPGTNDAGAKEWEMGCSPLRKRTVALNSVLAGLFGARARDRYRGGTTRVAYVMMDEENDDGRGLGGPEEQTEAEEAHLKAQRQTHAKRFQEPAGWAKRSDGRVAWHRLWPITQSPAPSLYAAVNLSLVGPCNRRPRSSRTHTSLMRLAVGCPLFDLVCGRLLRGPAQRRDVVGVSDCFRALFLWRMSRHR